MSDLTANNLIRAERGASFVEFTVKDGRIFLKNVNGHAFDFKENVETQLSNVSFSTDEIMSDRGNRYVRLHSDFLFDCYFEEPEAEFTRVCVVEKNGKAEITTYFELYEKFPVVVTYKTVKNISGNDVIIDDIPSFTAYGVYGSSFGTYVYKPYNSNLNECQWRKISLYDEGLFETFVGGTGTKRACTYNCGSQSSKDYIPAVVFQRDDEYTFLQVESGTVWSIEYGIFGGGIFVNAGGASKLNGGYERTLKADETYETPRVYITFGRDLDKVIENSTKYLRSKDGYTPRDNNATIFNEFMHLSWDSPEEKRTQELCKKVSEFGIDYYVIDACWHDEVVKSTSYVSPTKSIGKWEESKTRFPSGLAKTLKVMRDNSLKVGLWVEIQSIGVYVEELPLPEKCFFSINGVKTVNNGRYQLNFAVPETRIWASKILEKVINGYGIDYIKIDYNQNSYGTDTQGNICVSLEEHGRAYRDWLSEEKQKYPNVVFETCASGGQSINAESVQVSDVISTSDMESYYGYAHISTNILSIIPPEKAGVWCYPCDCRKKDENTTVNDIVVCMVNPMLARMHFASRFDTLSEDKTELVKEGLEVYKYVSSLNRNEFYPVFPNGFTCVEQTEFYSGVKVGNKILLTVYKFSDAEKTVELDLRKYGKGKAKVLFPSFAKDGVFEEDGKVCVKFGTEKSARLIEYELE